MDEATESAIFGVCSRESGGWPGPSLKRITQEKHPGQPDEGSLGYLGSQDTFYVGNYLPRRREAFLLLEADVL
jgi:hypothetical protein